ncbi:PWWP domain [Phytophthora cinnamomi]|uniref:PWWP domain n=1 Tax=Phytophthora cinnamomi TaxID=4785 RepID=UPI00355A99B1|nr:PWWP domain [Phytophthora cinnamomi]
MVIEELTQTSSSSSSFASSFSPPPSVREASSRSSSIARDNNHAGVVDSSSGFVVTSEARLDAEHEAQPTVQAASWEMKQPPANGVQDQKPAPVPSQLPKASTADSKMLNDDVLMDESKPAAPAIEVSRPTNVGVLSGNRRRKDPMDPPAKLSERISSVKMEGSRNQTTSSQTLEQDPDFYQDWSGGSRYEVDNKPWNILGWLTEGFKSRLQRK